MPANTKPILFIDFDGTLCHDRYWRSLQGDLFGIVQQTLFGGDNTLVVEWMRGKKTAEEVNAILAKKMQVPYQDLWEVFVDDCENMRVKQSTLTSINALRSKYTVILMTTNMDSFTRFTVPALELDSYFDDIINSADTGRMKQDEGGKEFLDQANLHSVSIADCILIDDSQKICDLFESLGGTSYRITHDTPIDKYLAELSREAE